MAKEKSGAVAEKTTAKKAPAESKYNQVIVRWFKGITDFDVTAALEALAGASGYESKLRESKGGRVTFQVDTAESAKISGRGRPKRLVAKEDEQKAVKLLKAAMRDPEKAPRIQELLGQSESGKDVSEELSKLVGIA